MFTDIIARQHWSIYWIDIRSLLSGPLRSIAPRSRAFFIARRHRAKIPCNIRSFILSSSAKECRTEVQYRRI